MTAEIPRLPFVGDNEVIQVSCFSLLVTILYTLLINKFNKKINIIKLYYFFDLKNFIITLILSIFIVGIFYILDKNLDKSNWDFLGYSESKDDIPASESSSESKHDNDFIKRKFNAHSSVSHCTVGIYILLNINRMSKIYYSSILFGILLIILGLVSYSRWSSSKKLAKKIDHLFMEAHINGLIVIFLSILFPKLEKIFVLSCIGLIIYRYFTYDTTYHLTIRSYFLLLLIFITTYQFKSSGNINILIYACILTLGGLIPKIADTTKNFKYGTALFHFMESFGFIMFYFWAKTINNK